MTPYMKILPAVLLAALLSLHAAIAENPLDAGATKDDLTKHHLGNGPGFSWQGTTYFNCHVIDVNGANVTIKSSGGDFEAPWAALPVDARAKMQHEYDRIQLAKTDTNATYGTVLQITKRGILLDTSAGPTRLPPIFIYGVGYGLADGDIWHGEVYPAGVINFTAPDGHVATYHAFAVSPALAGKILSSK